jgi:hypothetical protein
MRVGLGAGMGQSQRKSKSVPWSLAHSSRALGQLLRCNARTLGWQRICCQERKYLICALNVFAEDDLLMVRVYAGNGQCRQRGDG